MEAKLQQQAPQKAQGNKPNLTGIPTQMKLDFEQRSGLSFDDVRVHYNSDKPAQLQALAYTQGTQVYVGPGQERHLKHELGHVVQQKSGIVHPTHYIKGIPINNQPRLEHEADYPPIQHMLYHTTNKIIQLCPGSKKPGPKKPDLKKEAVPRRHQKEHRRRDDRAVTLKFPFGNESQALFASVHDGNFGSLYFKGGRIRLIHTDGPEYSSNEGTAKRFLLLSDDDKEINEAIDSLSEDFKTERKTCSSTIEGSVNNCKVFEISDKIGEISRIAACQSEKRYSRLYEVYFDRSFKFAGDHESRGGIVSLERSLFNTPEKIASLFYVAKLAQAVAQAAKDYINSEMEYTEKSIYTDMRRGKDIDNLTKNIYGKFDATIAHEHETTDLRAFRKAMDLKKDTLKKVIMQAAAVAQEEETSDDRIDRFGGYIGNRIFRSSGIIDYLELPVDDKD